MINFKLTRFYFLIIDDNQHMRVLVRTVLKALGAENIFESGEGAEALDMLETMPIDIVICDWNMKPMDGMAFTDKIRNAKDSPNRFVPIIMMTGHTERHRVEHARDAGVNEFLAKPISAAKLVDRVKAVIDRPRPFVDAPPFFGPCRRRLKSIWDGDERRTMRLVAEDWARGSDRDDNVVEI